MSASDILSGVLSVIGFIIEHKEALSSNKRKCTTLIAILQSLQSSITSDIDRFNNATEETRNLITKLDILVNRSNKVIQEYGNLSIVVKFFKAPGAEKEFAELRSELMFVCQALNLIEVVDVHKRLAQFQQDARADQDELLRLLQENSEKTQAEMQEYTQVLLKAGEISETRSAYQMDDLRNQMLYAANLASNERYRMMEEIDSKMYQMYGALDEGHRETIGSIEQLTILADKTAERFDKFEDRLTMFGLKMEQMNQIEAARTRDQMKRMEEALKELSNRVTLRPGEHLSRDLTAEARAIAEILMNDPRFRIDIFSPSNQTIILAPIEVPPLQEPVLQRPVLMRSLHDHVMNMSSEKGTGVVGITGLGGLGKTVLATMYCHEPAAQQAFPKSIFWVNAGAYTKEMNSAECQTILLSFARQMGFNVSKSNSQQQLQKFLQSSCAGRKILLVLDDVWLEQIGGLFANILDRSVGSCVLVTTRIEGVLTHLVKTNDPTSQPSETKVVLTKSISKSRAELIEQRIKQSLFNWPPLGFEDSLALLVEVIGIPKPPTGSQLEAVMEKVCTLCGHLPLAVSIVGQNISNSESVVDWEQVAGRLQYIVFEQGNDDLYRRVCDTSLASLNRNKALDQSIHDSFSCFAVFPQDTPIPLSALKHVLAPHVVDGVQLEDILNGLCARNLLQKVDKGCYQMHDMLHMAAESLVGDMSLLHRRIVEGYMTACKSDWLQLDDDGYVYNNIVKHWMLARSHVHPLPGLLFDLVFLQRRLQISSVRAAIADLEYVLQNESAVAAEADRVAVQAMRAIEYANKMRQQVPIPRPPRVAATEQDLASATLLLKTLRLSRRILNLDASQMCGQLIGRLREDPFARPPLVLPAPLKKLVQAAVKAFGFGWWLRPVHSRLQRPNSLLIGMMEGYCADAALYCSPDGKFTLLGADNGDITVVNEYHDVKMVIKETHFAKVTSVACFPKDDGETEIVSCDVSGNVKFWIFSSNSSNPPTEPWLEGDGEKVFIADDQVNRQVVIVSEHGRAMVRSLNVDDEGTPLSDHPEGVTCIALNKSGTMLLSAHADGSVVLSGLEPDAPLLQLHGHVAPVLCAAFSDDGKYFATGGLDHSIHIWSAEDKRLLHVLHDHRMTVRALTFQGHTLISGGGGDHSIPLSLNDCAIRIWQDPLNPGCRPVHLLGHSSYISALAINKDGHLVSSGADGETRVWFIPKRVPGARIDEVVTDCSISHGYHTAIKDALATTEPLVSVLFASSRGCVYDPSSGFMAESARAPRTYNILSQSISEDGNVIALLDATGTIKIMSSAMVYLNNIPAPQATTVILNRTGTKALLQTEKGPKFVDVASPKNNVKASQTSADTFEYLAYLIESNPTSFCILNASQTHAALVYPAKEGSDNSTVVVYALGVSERSSKPHRVETVQNYDKAFLTDDGRFLVCSFASEHIAFVYNLITKTSHHLHGLCLSVSVGAPVVLMGVGASLQLVSLLGSSPSVIGQTWVDADVTAGAANMLTGHVVCFDVSAGMHSYQWVPSGVPKIVNYSQEQRKYMAFFTTTAAIYDLQLELFDGCSVTVQREEAENSTTIASEKDIEKFAANLLKTYSSHKLPPFVPASTEPILGKGTPEQQRAQQKKRADLVKLWLRKCFDEIPQAPELRRFLLEGGAMNCDYPQVSPAPLTPVASIPSLLTRTPASATVVFKGPISRIKKTEIATTTSPKGMLLLDYSGSDRYIAQLRKTTSLHFSHATPRSTSSFTTMSCIECVNPTGCASLSLRRKADHTFIPSTPLHDAVQKDTAAVAAILNKGQSPNERNRYGDTPINLAALRGKQATVQLLIKHYACLDNQNYIGRTALMSAARHGFADIVQLLLDANADPTLREENTKNTAAVLAMRYGQMHIARTIHHAELKFVKSEKRDCVKAIVSKQSPEVVQPLLDSCPEVINGRTMLHYASLLGTKEVCDMLIHRGTIASDVILGRILQEDIRGDTPLMIVAGASTDEIIPRPRLFATMFANLSEFDEALQIVNKLTDTTVSGEDSTVVLNELLAQTHVPAVQQFITKFDTKYKLSLSKVRPSCRILSSTFLYSAIDGLPVEETGVAPGVLTVSSKHLLNDTPVRRMVGHRGGLLAYNETQIQAVQSKALVAAQLDSSGSGILTREILLGRKIRSVASCQTHCAAITETGSLLIWGDNKYGALGTTGSAVGVQEIPTVIFNNLPVLAVAVTDHATAVITESDVYKWGGYCTGVWDAGYPHQPVTLTRGHGPKPVDVQAGTGHFVVLLENGQILGWGKNEDNQLGLGASSTCERPQLLPTQNVQRIICGPANTLLITDTEAWMFGSNTNGQLCVGHRYPLERGVELYSLHPRLRPLDQISISAKTVIALSGNNVFAWGVLGSLSAEVATSPLSLSSYSLHYGSVRQVLANDLGLFVLSDIDSPITETLRDQADRLLFKEPRVSDKMKRIASLEAELVAAAPERPLEDIQAELKQLKELRLYSAPRRTLTPAETE